MNSNRDPASFVRKQKKAPQKMFVVSGTSPAALAERINEILEKEEGLEYHGQVVSNVVNSRTKIINGEPYVFNTIEYVQFFKRN